MNDEKPDLHALFSQAIEQNSPEELEEFLANACGDNLELRAELEGLLASHREAGGFLGGSEPTGLPAVTEKPGDNIGPYKLLQKIGAGGMGVVYMAEQTEPVERRVALKIIKPGMDSQQVIARFEAERQALAMMDHPNIAQVLDAGTTETGRPYFVMELVKGVSVTHYCDEHHLSPRSRLELFTTICQAVQHAHHKGIIHRDIKPSNILVTKYDDKPIPKVIDFGVAKATGRQLTDKTMFTQYGQIVGTIEYMSPEQADFSHLDVDTRSDVYSLGVLLYELLTGETPFDKKRLRSAAFDELLRIIREEEPPRPSTKLSSSDSLPTTAINRNTGPKKLSLIVRGELDWIVMKALEKEPNRRYDTASAFAADVLNYLNDEPVVACPPSRAYRLRKFARRHRAAFATGAVVAAALLIGIAGTTWQAVLALHARDRALNLEELASQRLTVVNGQKNEIMRKQRRQRLLYDAAPIVQTVRRTSGWREQVRRKVRSAHEMGKGSDITETFSRILSGVDASVEHPWGMTNGRAAFDSDDSHVVFSLPGGGVRVIELATGLSEELKGRPTEAAMGPLGIDSENRPVQAVCVSERKFEVFRLGAPEDFVTLEVPTGVLPDDMLNRQALSTPQAQALARKRLEELAQATPDMTCMVSWHGIAGDLPGLDTPQGTVVYWDTRSGEIVQTVPSAEAPLAIAEDGSIFAIGHVNGVVEIRSRESDKPLLVLRTGMSGITALALGRDPRNPTADSELSRWLIAAADQTGTIAVWALGTQKRLAEYRDDLHAVNVLKFGKGSLILASVGQRTAQLWDTFGAGHLLNFHASGYRSDIAWSSDGVRLAVPGYGADEPARARVWRVELDRGIKTMRGMSASGVKVVFSSDGRQVAAVASDWTVEVWDVTTAQLRRRLIVPRGTSPDNCGLCFSRDGSSFYFSAGQRMTQWDLSTGKQIEEWFLPEGLQDRIGITDDGRVLLMRYDREGVEDGSLPEHRGHMCRLREMMDGGQSRVIGHWDDFSRRIFSIAGKRNGSYFVMDGENSQEERFTLVVDITKVREPMRINPTQKNRSAPVVIADQANVYLQFVQHAEDDSKAASFRLANGQETARLPFLCTSLSPDGQFGFHPGSENQWCDLFHLPTQKHLVRFQLTSLPSGYQPNFSPDGKFVAWAHLDGTVAVCDLGQVSQELKAVDAGW